MGNVIKWLSTVKVLETGSLLRITTGLKGFREMVGFDLHIDLKTFVLCTVSS